jgi:hypothetical protein
MRTCGINAENDGFFRAETAAFPPVTLEAPSLVNHYYRAMMFGAYLSDIPLGSTRDKNDAENGSPPSRFALPGRALTRCAFSTLA